jgi:hypothetical protein
MRGRGCPSGAGESPRSPRFGRSGKEQTSHSSGGMRLSPIGEPSEGEGMPRSLPFTQLGKETMPRSPEGMAHPGPSCDAKGGERLIPSFSRGSQREEFRIPRRERVFPCLSDDAEGRECFTASFPESIPPREQDRQGAKNHIPSHSRDSKGRECRVPRMKRGLAPAARGPQSRQVGHDKGERPDSRRRSPPAEIVAGLRHVHSNLEVTPRRRSSSMLSGSGPRKPTLIPYRRHQA